MVAIDGWVSDAAARGLPRQPLPAHRVARVLGGSALSATVRRRRVSFGLVDDAHAAAADFLDDAVRTDVWCPQPSPARLEGERGRDRPGRFLEEPLVEAVWTARSDRTSPASAASVAAVRSSRLCRAAPWSSSAAWNSSLICRQRSGVTLARLRPTVEAPPRQVALLDVSPLDRRKRDSRP
jgi:hypothetical protein